MSNRTIARVGAVALVALTTGCQPAQHQDGSRKGGDTIYTRGAEVTRSETTRARGDSADPQEANGAELSVDKSSYRAGDQVGMRITSTTNDQLGFNPCTRTMERMQGSIWVVQAEPNRMCTMELWLLEPRATRSANTNLPSTLGVGTYRLVLLLSRQRPTPAGSPANWGTVRAVSSAFEVR